MSANPNTRDFLNARPGEKSEMIMDGYDRMVHDINEASVNLKVLNAWIATLPGLCELGHAKLPDVTEFRKKVESYVVATDKLTEQIVLNAEKIKGVASLYKNESA